MSEFTRRQTIVTAGAFLAAPALARASRKPPRILFICAAGTAKSAIARELLRRKARERGIAVSVFSRGLKIEDHVSQLLRLRLVADGLDTLRDPPAALSPGDLRAADMIVAFTPIPRAFGARDINDWSGVPSVNDAYPAARADLDKRIDALLDTIVATRGQSR